MERDASRARLSSTFPSSPVRSMTVSLSGLEASMKAVNGLDNEEDMAILTRGSTRASDGSRGIRKTSKICGPI